MAARKSRDDSTLSLFAGLQAPPPPSAAPVVSPPETHFFGSPLFPTRVTREALESLPPLPEGVLFGTSSWTYPGWQGQIYHRRYRATGDSLPMLEEYARCPLFQCAGMDSGFYRPPSVVQLQRHAAVLPPGFELVSKVWEALTIQRFAREPRYGDKGGSLNPDFLDPALCTDLVVGPWLEGLGEHAGPLMFEFQALYPPDRPTPEAWADRLEAFFSALPREGRYCVELRTPELLGPAYFEALERVGVAHLFNSWTRMPPIGVQLDMPGSLTASFAVSRALLVGGRSYAQAVDRFQPYDRLQEPAPEVRDHLLRLIQAARKRQTRIYVLVNNRLEGNSPATILGLRRALPNEAQ